MVRIDISAPRVREAFLFSESIKLERKKKAVEQNKAAQNIGRPFFAYLVLVLYVLYFYFPPLLFAIAKLLVV